MTHARRDSGRRHRHRVQAIITGCGLPLDARPIRAQQPPLPQGEGGGEGR
jgi:hypothetical protein